MNEVEKTLSVYTQLVDQGVDPEYAKVQLKHSAERLLEMEPDELATDILGNTPQKYITRKDEDEEPPAPAYDPVAAGRAMGAAARAKIENSTAFR